MERGLLRAAAERAAGPPEVDLPARADGLAARYEELAAAAEAAAVRWRWATPTSGRGDVEPLRLERMGCTPGQWLHRPPSPWREHEAIGFDALGRVACVRQYDAAGEVWLERFVAWSRERVEVFCFRPPLECGDDALPAELQSVALMRLAAGKPVGSERYLPPTGSCSRERYRHEGSRLARVEEDSCDEAGGLATVIKEVVYGEDGRVAGIDEIGPDGRRAVWRSGAQPDPAQTEVRPSVSGRPRGQACV
jgi:hypothetical protein